MRTKTSSLRKSALTWALGAVAALVALGAPSLGLAQSAPTLPSLKVLSAPLISPSAAETFYGTATTHSSSFTGSANAAAFSGTAPEIVELARALKNNPDLIYEYIHNQIELEPAFGLRKGALGALINKSGTPFDQNALFVATVRQAGYSAQYRIGRVTLTAAQSASWLGVSDIAATCKVLAAGGIPAAFNGASSSPSDCSVSGTFTSVTVLHIWSVVQINGTWYAYDPSFKAHTAPTALNLFTAAGLTSGQAGTTAATGIDTGAQSGVSYIHNASSTGLNTYLQARGAQLLTYLKANAANLDTAAVVAQPKIVAVNAAPAGWRNTAPVDYTAIADVSITGDIPDQYRSKLRVTVSATLNGLAQTNIIDWPFYVDDIDGRRLGLGSNFNRDQVANPPGARSAPYGSGTYTSNIYYLMLDDVPVASYSCSPTLNSYGGNAGPNCQLGMGGQVTLVASHPYAANSGTYASQTIVKPISVLAVPFAIVSGWGSVSPALLSKWSSEAVEDKAFPTLGAPPHPCGDVAGGETCWEQYESSSSDFTRQKTAASWLAQVSRMLYLQGQLGNTSIDHQHSIGIVDWRAAMNGSQFPKPISGVSNGGPIYFGITDQFTQLSIDTAISATSKVNSASQVNAVIRAVATTSATLEGSVLEQMEDLPDSSSTASRFAWGNSPDAEDPCFTSTNPRKFFDYTSSTSTSRAATYQYEGSATGCSAFPNFEYTGVGPFPSALESAIAAYQTAGFHITAPSESFLGPGSRFGPVISGTTTAFNKASRQRGGAFVATRFDANGNVVEVAHVLTGVDGITKGGGGKQPERFSEYDPKKAADILKDRFVDKSSVLGIDLKTGTVGYTTPTLASIGGQFPYGLDYKLTYKAGPDSCTGTFGPCTGAIQSGWNNAWDVRFSNSGSGAEAMGATSPFAAAGTLVAFLVMQDIYGSTGRTDLEKDVYVALTADWWRQQMVANTVTINRGFSGQQYIRLVDNSWLAPIGSPGVLTQSGARAKVRDNCQLAAVTLVGAANQSTGRRWDHSGVSFTLRNAGGDVLSFAPWTWIYDPDLNKCAVLYGYKPTTWTFPQGVTATFAYDYQQGVTGITTSLGRSVTFAQSAPGTGLTASVNGVTVGQTASGITDASGALWKFDFTSPILRSTTANSQRPVPFGELVHVYEPVNGSQAALEYSYDALGRVKQAKDAVAIQGTRNPYSFFIADGGRAEHDDPLGGAYVVYYDTDGNAVRNIDELGREVDSTYDGRHRVASRTFPEGDKEQFGYDANDNVTSLTKVGKSGASPASLLITATYETTWNKLASVTDAKSQTTSFTYYGSGVAGASMMATAVRPTVNGVQPTYNFQYNAIGLPTQVVDAAGYTTQSTYDTYGNLVTSKSGAAAVGASPALNLVTTYVTDGVGNVTQVTDPRGNYTATQYDVMRRKTGEQRRDGSTGKALTASALAYDLNGRTITESKATAFDASSNVTAWATTTKTYTPTSKVYTVTDPLGNVTTTTYDALDRVATVTDPVGRVSSKVYDAASQVLQERRAVGTALEQAYLTNTYGLDGEPLTVQDANNNLTTYGYDGYNRLVKMSLPSTTRGAGVSSTTDYEAYAYDNNSNRTSLRRRNPAAAANTTDAANTLTFSFDALDRETLKTVPGSRSVYTTYDLAGRPTLVSFDSATGPGVAYGYDSAGRLKSEATNGRTLQYGLDGAGNPTSMSWPDGQSLSSTFDAANRLTWTGIGTIGANFSYDGAGRLSGIARSNTTGSTLSYDADDRLTGLVHSFTSTSTNVTYGFGYTAASQISSNTLSNLQYRWPTSQAQAQTKTYDGLNRDSAIAAVGNGYDVRGNLTYDGVRTFTYDLENRLTAESGPATAALTYDPLGRLNQTVINGVTTQFLYAGSDLVAEYDGSGNVLRRYVDGAGVDDPQLWFEGAGVGSANARFLHKDRQGSVIGWSDASGTQQATYTYGPYGEPNSWSSTGSRFRYTGQMALPELGLYHYKARVYDPVAGRFLQTDPIGYKDGPDWYLYVGDDPVNRIDTDGQCEPFCGAAIGAIVGASFEVAKQTLVEGRDLQHLDGGAIAREAVIGGVAGATGAGIGALAEKGAALVATRAAASVTGAAVKGGVTSGVSSALHGDKPGTIAVKATAGAAFGGLGKAAGNAVTSAVGAAPKAVPGQLVTWGASTAQTSASKVAGTATSLAIGSGGKAATVAGCKEAGSCQ